MRIAAILTALLFANPALAQVEAVSERPDRTAVVVYRNRPVDTSALLTRLAEDDSYLREEGLALIVETRTLDLPAGDAVVRLRGVADGIVPQTAVLEGLSADVVERNVDFDLLSPASLLDRSIGETVRVVRTDRTTGRETVLPAVVRSSGGAPVLEIEGRYEALNCGGLTERIVFDRVPQGLGEQPVLSVRVRSREAGRRTVTLAYLATGLQWSADYVARLRPDGRTLDLTGWITLANFGGSGFTDAPVQVVAGNLNRDPDTVPVAPTERRQDHACWPLDTTTRGAGQLQVQGRRVADYLAGVPALSNSSVDVEEIVVTGSRIVAKLAELGDYKIYSLPEPTDVPARQTKQVRFLEQDNVRFSRVYAVEVWPGNDDEPEQPVLLLRLRNDAASGLGVPLPGGGVSLIETMDGRGLFAGQAKFEDKGVALPVELAFGEAMGLTLRQETIDRSTDGDRERVSMAVTLDNAKAGAVEVEVRPSESYRRGFRIVEEDIRHVISDGGYPVWRLRVPAGGSAAVRFAYVTDG